MIKNEKTRDWVNRIVSLVIAGGGCGENTALAQSDRTRA